MTTEVEIASPLCWIRGKRAVAKRILVAFPPAHAYGTSVEVFGGAGHILARKLEAHHLEVYNDLNDDLVNFWMGQRETMRRNCNAG